MLMSDESMNPLGRRRYYCNTLFPRALQTNNGVSASSDLLSSVKLVAEAAKSTFNNDSDKVDKEKVAGAAADLLGAAQDYGKLDKEKGIGQYVEKAENYLKQYESSGQSTPTSGTPTEPEVLPESHASGGYGKDSGAAAGGVGITSRWLKVS